MKLVSCEQIFLYRPNLAKSKTSKEIAVTSMRLCFSVKRKSLALSEAVILVALAATAMLDRLIIFPITPPLELAAAIKTGSKPGRPAAFKIFAA